MAETKAIVGKGDIRNTKCDVLGLLFVEDELKLSLAARAADKATGDVVSRLIADGFRGKKDEVERIPAGKNSPFGQVVLVGLGPRDKLELENYRRAGGKLMGAVSRGKNLRCNVEMRDPFKTGIGFDEISRALVTGAILKNYRFLDYKTRNNNKAPISTLAVYGDSKVLAKSIDKARIMANAQCMVRDLINRPAADLTPELFVQEARKTARGNNKLSIQVWKEGELKRHKMNAILAVGQGSHNPPRLVTITYQGARRKTPDLVIVGKGVTFDSGGISIKPSAKMDEMKGDMTGAATVLAVIDAVAKLGLKVNVNAVMGLAENMPGGGAQRPGDVIRMASGLTVEVKNTDAEGRLVLADALHHAAGMKPRHGIVDLATLTGACTIALGSQAIGLMGNNEDLLGKISTAGHVTGDRTWLLPLWDEYEELIESKVADIVNTSTRREAGTIVGGMFLKQFVGDTPWAHLDVASVFWLPKSGAYLSDGPSGKGARLMIKLIEGLQ